MNLCGWCCQYALYVGFIKSSWQSCTGDAAPRVVNMHGVRVVYMYEEGVADSCDSSDALELSILIGVDQYWKVATGGILCGNTGPTAMGMGSLWACSWT